MNNNTTLDAGIPTENISPIITSIEMFIFVLTVLGNTVVILTVYFVKRLRTTLNLLVVNLSICDILIVTLSIPFGIALQQNQEKGYIFGPVGCRILYPLATLATNGAVFTLLCITLERYIAISHPMRWRQCKRHLSKIICFIYLYALITVTPYAYYLEHKKFEYGYSCGESWSETSSKTYTIFLFLIQYGIPLPLMIFFYTKAWIYIKIQNDHAIKLSEQQRVSRGMSLISKTEIKLFREKMKHSGYGYEMKRMCSFNCLSKLIPRSRHQQENDVESQPESLNDEPFLGDQRRRQTIRTFLMFVTIVVIFAVCSLPNQITWLWISFFRETSHALSDFTTTVFYMLHYSNCVLNPWIYGGLNRTFRRGYKKVLCCDKTISIETGSIVQETLDTASPRHDLFRDGIITRSPVNFIHCGSVDSISNIGSMDSMESTEDIEKNTVTQKKRVKFRLSVGSFSSRKSSTEREKRKLSMSLTVSRQRKLTLPEISNMNYNIPSYKRKDSIPHMARLLVPKYEVDETLAVLPPAKKTLTMSEKMFAKKRKMSAFLPSFKKSSEEQEKMIIYGRVNKKIHGDLPECFVTDERNHTRELNYSNNSLNEINNNNSNSNRNNSRSSSSSSSDDSSTDVGTVDEKKHSLDSTDTINENLLANYLDDISEEQIFSEFPHEPSTAETTTSNGNSSDEENIDELNSEEENNTRNKRTKDTEFDPQVYNTLIQDEYVSINNEYFPYDWYSRSHGNEFDFSQLEASQESYI